MRRTEFPTSNDEQKEVVFCTDSCPMPFPVLTAVHEHVVFAGVGVEVTVEVDGPFLKDFGHQLLLSNVRKMEPTFC
jgi:hypothetical protein